MSVKGKTSQRGLRELPTDERCGDNCALAHSQHCRQARDCPCELWVESDASADDRAEDELRRLQRLLGVVSKGLIDIEQGAWHPAVVMSKLQPLRRLLAKEGF